MTTTLCSAPSHSHCEKLSPQLFTIPDHSTPAPPSMCSAGERYVSTVEHKDYPFFATQWHPEKPAYEFSDPTIPHSRTAIDAGYATASLLVDVARLSSHKVSYEHEVKLVVQNFVPHFLPAEGGQEDPEDPLPDTMWFIPEPKHRRKDPEPVPDIIDVDDTDAGSQVNDALAAALAKAEGLLWRGRAGLKGLLGDAVLV